VSVDEMTGVQALERAAPDLPVQPGKVARREFENVRHGTQTVIVLIPGEAAHQNEMMSPAVTE
jgi:hypothetical protein